MAFRSHVPTIEMVTQPMEAGMTEKGVDRETAETQVGFDTHLMAELTALRVIVQLLMHAEERRSPGFSTSVVAVFDSVLGQDKALQDPGMNSMAREIVRAITAATATDITNPSQGAAEPKNSTDAS